MFLSATAHRTGTGPWRFVITWRRQAFASFWIMIRLVHGLVGQSVPEEAVRVIMEIDEETTGLLRDIAAYQDTDDTDAILDILNSKHRAIEESPDVVIRGATALISMQHPKRALEAIESAQRKFPRSVRLQQLQGLALRRLNRTKDAQRVLARLYTDGHRDPETQGIYAATWMARYDESGDRAHLERSFTLYYDAFRASPKDEYVGINAASKSAFLGERDQSRELAEEVERLVEHYSDGSDFWKSLTLAEARVLLGRYSDAAEIYRETVRRHSTRAGDLNSTIRQLRTLIQALKIPKEEATELLDALKAS